jgi:signal transduction histidine kinase
MASKRRNCLVLVQRKNDSLYNDFIGKFYHFPERYIGQFRNVPVEFIYYDPGGEGGYFGYGRIEKPPFEDKREKDHFFAEIAEYNPFSRIVPLHDEKGQTREDATHYNPRNAVREISADILDEICLDGGINLSFKADAHLIKVLGEQLIASEKVGILELIKNAYDAQASYCRVVIEKIDSLPKIEGNLYEFKEYEGPVIVIEDDGIGMTKDIIENGWLRPASTIKTNIKERMKRERGNAIKTNTIEVYDRLISQLREEYKGRIPLGEKGVGRFATHRLGKKLVLKTKVKSLDYEYVLKIDWDDFDEIGEKATDLDSIGISLNKRTPSRDYGKTNSGTQLIIYGGREGFTWDESKVREINNSIVRLNTPNPRPHTRESGFHVYLECPQILDLKTYDISKDFEPTFTFEGLVDENGILDYKLEFKPPPSVPMSPDMMKDREFDLRKTDKDYWKDISGASLFRKSESGAFFIHLDVWYRRAPWISGPHGSEFTGYLDVLGGISIYRDGINVFPAEWGAETDWLGLRQRQIKQVYRMSYYNMIGNIEIDQTATLNLLDKTDREGLIKNRAFVDLTRLVYLIIDKIVEREFIAKREKYQDLTMDITRNPRVLKNYVKQTEVLISNILKNYPVKEDPYSILNEFGEADKREPAIANIQKSIGNLQESLDLIQEAQYLLTEQAGYGLAIAVSLHEITKNVSNFYTGMMRIIRSGEIDLMKVNEILTASQFLGLELRRLRPLRATRVENWVEFLVLKSIKFIGDVYKKKLDGSNIRLDIEGNDFKVFGRFAAVNQVFTNLIDNSFYWLDTIENTEKVILIKINGSNRTVIVADSGPGLHNAIMKYLFQPGYSLRKDASGLGLYICKYYMQDMKGDIYVTPDKDRIESLPGAQFTLDFKKVAREKEEV